MHAIARLPVRILVALALVVAPTTLLTAGKAEALPSRTCVAYVSPITEDTIADRYRVYSDVTCTKARNVTVNFFIRYRNISGWHITHRVSKSFSSLNGAYIIGTKDISVHSVAYMYAETTVCFGSPRMCRSDSSSRGRP